MGEVALHWVADFTIKSPRTAVSVEAVDAEILCNTS